MNPSTCFHRPAECGVPKAKARGLPRAASKGSLLIVAMLLCAIIGVSLVSYLKLTQTAMKSADRSFLMMSNLDLAEIGVEQAMAAFYDETTGTTAATAFAGWTQNTSTSPHSATRTYSSFTPAPGASGVVRVYVKNFDSPSSGVIVAKATITPASGPVIDKFVEVTLKPRGLFTNGLVAKNAVTWVGHPEADSWNSNPDADAATAAVAYSLSVQLAGCIVASVNSSISLGSGGNIYGYAKTGSSGSTSGGSVHGLGTTTNDTTRIANDFTATLPDPTVPSPSVTNVLAAVPSTLPLGTHTIASDGRYYYSWGSALGGITANTTITDKVTIIMTGRAGADAIRLTGTKTLTLGAAGSVILYTDGDISAFGNGIVNSTTAENFQIYGTGTSSGSQSVAIGGNGNLVAAVYAPNAAVSLRGGGSSGNVMGSIVGKTIDMNGGTNFHYDEALGTLSGSGTSVSKWKELQTATERAVYTSVLAF